MNDGFAIARAGLAIGLCTIAAQPAAAQSMNDKVWAEISFFKPAAQTAVQVEDRTDEEPATIISLEDDLKFKDSDSLPSALVGGQMGNGFWVYGEYFAIDRESRATIEREIRFAGVKFEASANVLSDFETDTYRLGVGWDFLRRDNYAIGVSGGLHATNFVIQLEGEASFAGATTEFVTRKRNALAPLPTLGVHGEVEVIPRLTLRGKLDYLDLTLNNASGRIFNGEAMLLYNINDNIALGAGYRHVDMRLELAKQDWTGSIDYQFDGPKLTLKVGLR